MSAKFVLSFTKFWFFFFNFDNFLDYQNYAFASNDSYLDGL